MKLPASPAAAEFTNRPEDARKPTHKRSKRASERPDPRLRQLEQLHANTNVQENLKLADGQRVKLQNQHSGSLFTRKSQPLPNFDIEFANLGGHKPARYEDSDDDLPDAKSLLRSTTGGNRPSSDTRYTNSEVDDLIRDLPSSDLALPHIRARDGQDHLTPESRRPPNLAPPSTTFIPADRPSQPTKRAFDVDALETPRNSKRTRRQERMPMDEGYYSLAERPDPLVRSQRS